MVALAILVVAFVRIVSLSVFTLLNDPKNATNRLFFLFSLVLAFYLAANYQINLQDTDAGALFWVRLVMTSALFIVLLFYLLATTFPGPKLRTKNWTFWFAVIFTLVMTPVSLLDYIWTSAFAT